MVLGNQNQIAEEASKKFPGLVQGAAEHVALLEQSIKYMLYKHYTTYAKCQSNAFMIGLFSLVSSAAAIVLGQEAVKKLIPMTVQMRTMAPVLGGCVVGYVVARDRTKRCQDMWMALEDKHTAISGDDQGSSFSS